MNDASSAKIAATVALELELVRPTEMGPPTASSRKDDDKGGLRGYPGVGGVRTQIVGLRRRVVELEALVAELRADPNTRVARYERELQRRQAVIDRQDRELSDRALKSRGRG